MGQKWCVLRIAVVLTFCISGVVSAVGVAADLYPAPWRGDDGSTWAAWDFSDNNPSPAPDMGVNPYGEPDLIARPGFGQGWIHQWDNHEGIWPLSGNIEVFIPNNPVPNPVKYIQVQMIWQSQAFGNQPWVHEHSGLDVVERELVMETPLDGDWMYSQYLFTIEPNPDSEIIRVDGGVLVDSLVIDTICIPEPVTMLLLAVGSVAVLRRKR